MLWGAVTVLALSGCSSGDSSGGDSADLAAAKESACSRLREYASTGIPAQYIDDAVSLLEDVADTLLAADLPDAADAVIRKAIPTVQADFVTALQFKPIVRDIVSTWCN